MEHDPLIEEDDSGPHDSSATKSIYKCMKTLNEGSKQNGGGAAHSGHLLRKSSRDGSFSPFWVVLDPSTGYMTCYLSQESSNEERRIKVSFIKAERIQVKDSFAMEQVEANSNDWSKYRLHVWSRKRHFLFAAESDGEFQPWIEASKSFMNARFTNEQIANKKNAFTQVRVMLESQDEAQIKQYAHLRAVLDKSMVLGSPKNQKYKQGYLSAKTKNGKWKEQFLVLTKKYIIGYRIRDKEMPQWVLALKYLVNIEQEGNVFTVVTPLMTMHFQAKHDVAAGEWSRAIQLALLHKKPDDSSSHVLGNLEEEFDAPLIDGNLVLRYEIPGLFGSKKKSFQIKSEVITIGRASTNTLSFDDHKQSRNHAKIELRHGRPPILYDLGSTYGTSVNSQPVTKQALRVGDRIEIGTTTLTLESQ